MLILAPLLLQVSLSGIGDETEGCTDEAGPRALSACYYEHASEWDARMNRAYTAALKSPRAYDVAALKKAQTRWLEYRKAECAFYAKQGGTMRFIQSGYCLLDLNRRRALELEVIPLP